MIAKKASKLIPEVAAKNNVSEELVEDLTSFFWKEVRNNIVNIKHHNISVKGLGIFKAKPWKVKDTLDKCQDILNAYKKRIGTGTPTFQQHAIMKDIQEKYDKVLNLQTLVEKEKERERLKKLERIEYDRLKTHLEVKVEDPSGTI